MEFSKKHLKWLLPLGLAVGATACGTEGLAESDGSDQTLDESAFASPAQLDLNNLGPAPAFGEGELSPELASAVETLQDITVLQDVYTEEQRSALQTIATSGDARLAWFVGDLLRWSGSFEMRNDLVSAGSQLIGIDVIDDPGGPWLGLTNPLIAWDIPDYPEYLSAKRTLFSQFQPEWEQLFEDGREVDWRHVSWGGVDIDNREYNPEELCNCIPAIDNPELLTVDEADWLEDDDVIFGVEINGETRAYPRQIMEVREMVNDTLGGRDFAMPYCTLCGSAQVFFTDDLPDGVERPIMRTSGLLIRSNKVMFDVESRSVFDTFTGEAVTGPLADEGVQLDQATVLVTTWGEWSEANPETTVLVEEDAFGQDFDFRNNRDANGPIFAVGEVDPRLPVQEDIIGVIKADGDTVAFPSNAAREALEAGETVELNGVTLELDSGGLRTFDANGDEIASHQAFWFAWSQFRPDTALWEA